MIEWISVEDKLPEQNQWVLAIDKDLYFFTCEYERLEARYSPGYFDSWKSGLCCGREPGDPTHWMPLPDKPEK